MSNAACEAVIQKYCHELKLAAVVRDYPAICRFLGARRRMLTDKRPLPTRDRLRCCTAISGGTKTSNLPCAPELADLGASPSWCTRSVNVALKAAVCAVPPRRLMQPRMPRIRQTGLNEDTLYPSLPTHSNRRRISAPECCTPHPR